VLVEAAALAAVDRADWPALFAAWVGSPDPTGRQVAGVGGGNATTSKVAVVQPSRRPDADVDYEFFQMIVGTGAADRIGTCGNMSSAAAQFAIENGLVAPRAPLTLVRLHDVNTGGRIHVGVEVDHDGGVVYEGEHVLAGVAGTGSPVTVRFLDAGGATTGRLLPTGRLDDVVQTAWGPCTVSLVDAANPVVFAHAGSLPIPVPWDAQELERSADALELLAALRRWGAARCGFSAAEEDADARSPMYPFVAVYDDAGEAAGDGTTPDARIVVLSGGRTHRATPLSVGLAAAALRGLRSGADRAVRLRIRHPSGELEVRVGTTHDGSSAVVEVLEVVLTARPIMRGELLVG
jgi:2-methylaconitate cis-trans-isomerase PrpF